MDMPAEQQAIMCSTKQLKDCQQYSSCKNQYELNQVFSKLKQIRAYFYDQILQIDQTIGAKNWIGHYMPKCFIFSKNPVQIQRVQKPVICGLCQQNIIYVSSIKMKDQDQKINVCIECFALNQALHNKNQEQWNYSRAFYTHLKKFQQKYNIVNLRKLMCVQQMRALGNFEGLSNRDRKFMFILIGSYPKEKISVSNMRKVQEIWRQHRNQFRHNWNNLLFEHSGKKKDFKLYNNLSITDYPIKKNNKQKRKSSSQDNEEGPKNKPNGPTKKIAKK